MDKYFIMLLYIFIPIISFIIGFLFCLIYFIFIKKKSLKIIKKAHINSEKIYNKTVDKAKFEAIKIREDVKKLQEQNQKQFLIDEQFLNERKKNLKDYEFILNKLEQSLSQKKISLNNKIHSINDKLSNISSFTVEEAKKMLLYNLQKELRQEMNRVVKEYKYKTKLECKKYAQNIIVDSIDRFSSDIITEKTLSIVKFKNLDIKSKIIGKEGRNIKSFEKISGVDLIIDSTPGIIRLSCFNYKRREIAKIALENLIKDGRIQPNKIEEFLKKAKVKIIEKSTEAGYKVIQELGINLHPKLVEHLGSLKYRTSYSQNVLLHSVEVAKLASYMAIELNLNPKIALKAGLLHDIGKSIDQENEGTHVTLGVELARKYKEDKYVINAIESHHEDVQKTTPYSSLVSAADTLSAGRPGARSDVFEKFIKRMTQLEELCLKINGVNKAYALQSGRKIRVILDAKKVDDLEAYKIGKEIKNLISSSSIIIPGDIIIDIIRELRFEESIKK